MLLVAEPFNPAARGFHVVYRAGETNRCPGCDRSQWLVGRITAECAFCSTAIVISDCPRIVPTTPLSGSAAGKEGRVDLPPSDPPTFPEEK